LLQGVRGIDALLHVTSDVYSAADERRVALLALLDLSAAFDDTYTVFDWRLGSKARRWLALIVPRAWTQRVY